MKKFIRNSILFCLPVLLGSFSLFLIPLDKQFAYHYVKGECSDKASWMYHRVFEDERPVDIVFSGASQTGSAVIDETISEKLSQTAGKNIEVVNYGYCRGGRDIQYTMLKDLFHQKHPQLLVLEVTEDEPKKSHPVFPYLADTKDLLGSFTPLNLRYFTSIWKGVTVRFESLRAQVTNSYRYKEHGSYPPFGYRGSSHTVKREYINENAKKWEHRFSRQKPGSLRRIELSYSKHYVRKIVELANKNNCEVAFLYLRESGSNLKVPLLEEYYLDFGELIILPNEIFENSNNWKDPTHFNDSGAKEASEFLAPVLADHIQ